MTRIESWLIGTTVVEDRAVMSEAIFFQELLGTSNTLISSVGTPCLSQPPMIVGGQELGIIAV